MWRESEEGAVGAGARSAISALIKSNMLTTKKQADCAVIYQNGERYCLGG